MTASPQLVQLAHFQQFEMTAEDGRLLGHVAVHIQHAAVVVTQHADPVVAHGGGDPGGVHPVVDFRPGFLVLQVAGDQVIIDAGAVEHAGDLRRGAGLAVLQPLTMLSLLAIFLSLLATMDYISTTIPIFRI